MPEVLTPNSEFIVADSTIINLLVAAFFFLMPISSLWYDAGSSLLDIFMLLGFVPGVIFLVKAFKKRAAISVNKNGISFFNTSVTDWKHFKGAAAKQMPLGIGRISDNVILTVEYYKDSTVHGFYKKTIPLTNTQNKSEEEIIAAIEFFYRLSLQS